MEPNSNCKLKLKIIEAHFLKDADTFGKQDPYVKFVYDDREFRTSTRDDAGKHAVFNEEFVLEDLGKQVQLGGSLVLKAYDEDVGSSDWLGATAPLSFSECIANANENKREVDLVGEKGKKAGRIAFATQYIWAEPDPPKVKRDEIAKPLNKKCKLDVTIVEASFLKDADTFGK